jgi:hypothetical protein
MPPAIDGYLSASQLDAGYSKAAISILLFGAAEQLSSTGHRDKNVIAVADPSELHPLDVKCTKSFAGSLKSQLWKQTRRICLSASASSVSAPRGGPHYLRA